MLLVSGEGLLHACISLGSPKLFSVLIIQTSIQFYIEVCGVELRNCIYILIRLATRFESHRGQAYFSSLPGVDIHSE